MHTPTFPQGRGRPGEERERKGNDLEREQPMGEPKRDRETAGPEQSWEVRQKGRAEAGREGKEWPNPTLGSTGGIGQAKGKHSG